MCQIFSKEKIASAFNSFTSLGCKSPNFKSIILVRIKRKHGCPIAAHIRLTCRFFPSVNVTSIHDIGLFPDALGSGKRVQIG